MSRIFDALQRSESERVGTESQALPKGPDLLRRAERRVASKWEGATSHKGDEPAKITGGVEFFGRDGVVPAELVGETPGGVESLPAAMRLEILSRFQSLSISPPTQSRLVCLTDRENPTAEAVRLLGVRLRNLRRVRALRKVLITSTIPQEGKSMIAANLACALAHTSDERTVLVEGDLRRPSLSQMFGIHQARGLCDWLQDEEGPLPNVYNLDAAGIWMLPAGGASRNPLELLQSQRLPLLMEQLAACFDWIIIDSPPVLPLADTSIWMRLADGILLVARQGITEKQQLQKGLDALDSQKLLGALLNGTMASAYSGYYYRSSVPS
jgi:capsular exopolysaccharide synthesis family protein